MRCVPPSPLAARRAIEYIWASIDRALASRLVRKGALTLPETDVVRVRRWIDAHNARLPERAVGLIRFEMDVDSRSITVLECRPPWREGIGTQWTRQPVARLRYTKVRRDWQIYWCDRNIEFHVYDFAEPTPNIQELLVHLDEDPTAIFWG